MQHSTQPGRTARGPVAGAVCAVGAALAHLGAGGQVTPGAFAWVLAGSVVAGAVLLRRDPDPAATLGLALLAQVGWHAAWMTTAGGQGGEQSAVLMLLSHLAAAGLTTVVALAAERELLSLARGVVARVLPAAERGASPLPVRRGQRVPDLRPQPPASWSGAGSTCGLRAPPVRPTSPTRP